jgi:hypothetical protein
MAWLDRNSRSPRETIESYEDQGDSEREENALAFDLKWQPIQGI